MRYGRSDSQRSQSTVSSNTSCGVARRRSRPSDDDDDDYIRSRYKNNNNNKTSRFGDRQHGDFRRRRHDNGVRQRRKLLFSSWTDRVVSSRSSNVDRRRLDLDVQNVVDRRRGSVSPPYNTSGRSSRERITQQRSRSERNADDVAAAASRKRRRDGRPVSRRRENGITGDGGGGGVGGVGGHGWGRDGIGRSPVQCPVGLRDSNRCVADVKDQGRRSLRSCRHEQRDVTTLQLDDSWHQRSVGNGPGPVRCRRRRCSGCRCRGGRDECCNGSWPAVGCGQRNGLLPVPSSCDPVMFLDGLDKEGKPEYSGDSSSARIPISSTPAASRGERVRDKTAALSDIEPLSFAGYVTSSPSSPAAAAVIASSPSLPRPVVAGAASSYNSVSDHSSSATSSTNCVLQENSFHPITPSVDTCSLPVNTMSSERATGYGVIRNNNNIAYSCLVCKLSDMSLQEFSQHMSSRGHLLEMNEAVRTHLSKTRQQLQNMKTERRLRKQLQLQDALTITATTTAAMELTRIVV